MLEEDDLTDSEEEDERLFTKNFDSELRDNFIVNFHPESIVHNYDEINVLSTVTRNKKGIIIDEFHKTSPFLTKYEKTKIIGQRARQINIGAKPFIKVDKNVIDGILIAQSELEKKKIPFIIRRPLPHGGSEYWKLQDLEILE